MADDKPVHLRGVEGRVRPDGSVARSHKYLVVKEDEATGDPLEFGHFETEEDARAFVRSHRVAGSRDKLSVQAVGGKVSSGG